MLTHSEIVRRAGKPEEIAAVVGVSVHTVRSWIQRDSIPADKWVAMVGAGWATLDDLAIAAASPRVA